MFEGTYAPPFYTNLYEFKDGPQDDIFVDSYVFLPDPSPTAPLPVLNTTALSTSFRYALFVQCTEPLNVLVLTYSHRRRRSTSGRRYWKSRVSY